MLRFLASKLRRFIQEHKSEGVNVNTDQILVHAI